MPNLQSHGIGQLCNIKVPRSVVPFLWHSIFDAVPCLRCLAKAKETGNQRGGRGVPKLLKKTLELLGELGTRVSAEEGIDLPVARAAFAKVLAGIAVCVPQERVETCATLGGHVAVNTAQESNCLVKVHLHSMRRQTWPAALKQLSSRPSGVPCSLPSWVW